MKLYVFAATVLIAGAAVSKQCRDLPCRDFPNCPPEPLPTIAPTPTPPCPNPEPPPIGCNLPTPTPPPAGSVGNPIPQGRMWMVEGDAYPAASRPAPEFGDVLDSIASQALSCDIGSDCPTRMPMQAYIQTVAAVARNRGYDAGQHEDGASDEIAIGNLGDGGRRNQGYHIYNEGGGKVVWFRGVSGGESDWRNGRGPYRDTWRAAVEQPPTPTPPPATPPPGPEPSVCPNTPAANTGVIHCSVKPARQDQTWCDWTPKVNDRDWCPIWENPRTMVVCPLRPEGHPERRDCDYLLGFPTWTNADPAEGDPFHATSGRGVTVRVTLANGAVVETVTP